MSTPAHWYNTEDPSTLSNPGSVRSTHMHINWTVDFERSVVAGSVVHTVEVVEPCEHLVLDTSCDLDVSSVAVGGVEAPFAWGDSHPVFGRALRIALGSAGATAGATAEVEVFYTSHPAASGAQWMPPSQTASGLYPFLFTQCQAIHARSLVPCQDAPGVKLTWSATVKAPAWSTVLMSAVEEAPPSEPVDGLRTFHFRQSVRTCTYLLAIAVGELVSRDISPRVRVWAEPSEVEKVEYEFAQTEEFIQIAEGLVGAYGWGRYDMLSLPASFAYGGMENPNMTFLTPSLLAGDRSLANVVAHELAHSWTGNAVTNATWQHFWLNEGFTVFLERKLLAGIHKDDKYRHLHAWLGWTKLKDSVDLMMKMGHPEFTRLIPPLADVDPDDAFSAVPYERGFNLLFHLEGLIGTPVFDEFLHAYIAEYSYKTLTSGAFRDFFLNFCDGKGPDVRAKVDVVDWAAWIDGEGMPPVTPEFDTSLASEALALAQAWLSAPPGQAPEGVGSSPSPGFSATLWMVFLEELVERTDERGVALPEASILALDEAYGFTASGNSEIRLRWYTLCIKAECAWIVDKAVEFITTIGRMKFVRPLYRLLYASKVGRKAAIEAFTTHRSFYQSVTAKMVARDLGMDKPRGLAGSVYTVGIATAVAVVVAAGAAALAIMMHRRK